MSLSHTKLWINNQSTPSGESAGLNKIHNFFTPWPSHDTVVCVDNIRQLRCEHMQGAGAAIHRCCGLWKGLWSCVSPNASDFRTIPCLRGFAVQCVAHRVVARRPDFRWFPGNLGSLHTVNSGVNSNRVLPSTALKSCVSMIVVAHLAQLLIHSHCDLGFNTLCIRKRLVWCGAVVWCGVVVWYAVLWFGEQSNDTHSTPLHSHESHSTREHSINTHSTRRHSHTQMTLTARADIQVTLTARADTQMTLTARANTLMTLTARTDTQVTLTARADTQMKVTVRANTQMTLRARANTQLTLTARANTQMTLTAR